MRSPRTQSQQGLFRRKSNTHTNPLQTNRNPESFAALGGKIDLFKCNENELLTCKVLVYAITSEEIAKLIAHVVTSE